MQDFGGAACACSLPSSCSPCPGYRGERRRRRRPRVLGRPGWSRERTGLGLTLFDPGIGPSARSSSRARHMTRPTSSPASRASSGRTPPRPGSPCSRPGRPRSAPASSSTSSRGRPRDPDRGVPVRPHHVRERTESRRPARALPPSRLRRLVGRGSLQRPVQPVRARALRVDTALCGLVRGAVDRDDGLSLLRGDRLQRGPDHLRPGRARLWDLPARLDGSPDRGMRGVAISRICCRCCAGWTLRITR